MSAELNFDFFKVNYDKISPEQGKILIAEPGLIDLNFKRSVILLVEHNENGTVGFVLNRILNYKLSELLPDFPDFDAKISLGGPVSPKSIHFIHTLGDIVPKTNHIADNIYWGGDFEAIKSLIIENKITSKQILFFVGYSGWSVEQLNREITEGSWVVTKLHPVKIFTASEDLWIDTVREMGSNFKPWTLYPDDPSLN
ncbi:MAG TPA: transcriptional regulator [Bacteroidales bacterium]|nr:transcriptional regulator [Bacteroidales bacterium]